MPQQELSYLTTNSRTPEDLLFEHATQVLESEERAQCWMREPNLALGRKTPLEMVNSEDFQSSEEAHELLRRIEYGNYS
jgi:putative toxin-antitoxin system antitoxin component (TIGR02293 family)